MLQLCSVILIVAAAYGSAVPKLDGRIVGGATVTINEYPYQISMQYNGRHQCGGSIIGERYILTAAHCTDGTVAANWKIRAGSSYYAKGGQMVPVYKIHQHESYNPVTSDYDIAILELSHRVVYGLAQPIELADANFLALEGLLAKVTGWGYTTARRDKAEQLQMLAVPIVSIKTCKDLYKDLHISERMICAGYLEGGKDACQGDSGGPLVYKNKLIGIVSWGLGCAQPNQPGVYTNVAELSNFITSITK